MSKPKKTRRLNALQSNKRVLAIIMFMFFLAILPMVSATATNSTYVAGTGEAIVYGGLNLILLVFLIGCFVIFLSYDNLLSRISSFGFGYLLVVAISFVGWQMASDFITSTFLIGMFRIIFLALVIGIFPLVIGAFAYYIYMITKIKEIENLMKHGMSESDAERRTRRRR